MDKQRGPLGDIYFLHFHISIYIVSCYKCLFYVFSYQLATKFRKYHSLCPLDNTFCLNCGLLDATAANNTQLLVSLIRFMTYDILVQISSCANDVMYAT